MKIPKILRDVPLSEYSQEFGSETLTVWVNPPHRLVRERWAIFLDARKLSALPAEKREDALKEQADRQRAWMSEILSQGANPVSADELAEWYDQSPDFVQWLTRRVATLMDTYRAEEKKS